MGWWRAQTRVLGRQGGSQTHRGAWPELCSHEPEGGQGEQRGELGGSELGHWAGSAHVQKVSSA